MRIGIGLPNVLPGSTGGLMLDWARRAEERGFGFLSTVGRLGYGSFDSLISLAAVAGATERIGLQSNVILAPLVPEALLAKSVTTLAAFAGDRLTLGVGLGARESDYDAVGADFHRRGAILDRQVELLRRSWAGEAVVGGERIGPTPPARPGLLFGGHSEAMIRRTARWGDGWTGATGGAERNGPVLRRIREAWAEAGREGDPRFVGLVYFGLGEGAEGPDSESVRNLTGYYAFFGRERAEAIGREAVRSGQAVREAVEACRAAGFTEVTFTPTLPRLDQVDLLADALAATAG
jgi:alkanesulfonate monooxygenase SsuD/methylene tetrahydromethanopterin reductase-like flavin-dependent oxidoreductase (luciferase family)